LYLFFFQYTTAPRLVRAHHEGQTQRFCCFTGVICVCDKLRSFTYIMIISYQCHVCQAYAAVRFLLQYAIPVSVFAYCYGRIFRTIRRQSKVVGGHAGRGQNIAMTTTSRDQNAGQAQQQTTGAASGAKLTHTELTVLKTMITVIVVFVIFWCVPAFTGIFLVTRDGVSTVIGPQICTVLYRAAWNANVD